MRTHITFLGALLISEVAAQFAQHEVRGFDLVDLEPTHLPQEPNEAHDAYGAEPTLVSSSAASASDVVYEGAELSRRIDLGSSVPNIDDISDQVFNNVKGEVADAANAATKGVSDALSKALSTLSDAANAAKKAVQDGIDAAEKAFDDVKKTIEDLFNKAKAELEKLLDEASNAIRQWVWEHIGRPLVIILVILSIPFVLLFLWGVLAHCLKSRAEGAEDPSPSSANVEMRPMGAGSGSAGETKSTSSSGSTIARVIVRGWDKHGQGLLGLFPVLGSFVAWRARSRQLDEMARLNKRLKKQLEEITRLRKDVNWLMGEMSNWRPSRPEPKENPFAGGDE
ncbi:Uu.00g058360.m01.CDS01 [Anthostomella pinea]|uniref:Uu.00g058360.m01.CDS01 n=1 Tax=Anthostomella pinea TaxID=933095 RepID=A0AAI8VRX7_9PEZI|nr:Uu.00g058360.m01.CDS01 [Anthostomella pinea]